jgi:hypothetical protein
VGIPLIQVHNAYTEVMEIRSTQYQPHGPGSMPEHPMTPSGIGLRNMLLFSLGHIWLSECPVESTERADEGVPGEENSASRKTCKRMHRAEICGRLVSSKGSSSHRPRFADAAVHRHTGILLQDARCATRICRCRASETFGQTPL